MNRETLRAGASLRTALRASATPFAMSTTGVRYSSRLPMIAQPTFWKSLVPKPFRSAGNPGEKKTRSKEWNPATFFIIIFLLIGSNAMQMIALRKDFEAFTRRADVRVSLLREVVEKIQRGEKVDVEQVLGTGDPRKEEEWEEVLKEIEKDEAMKTQKKKQLESSPKSNSDSAAPGSAQNNVQATTAIKTGRASFF